MRPIHSLTRFEILIHLLDGPTTVDELEDEISDCGHENLLQHLSRLRKQGFLVGNGGVELTDQGREEALDLYQRLKDLVE